jgi:hypothetical protein
MVYIEQVNRRVQRAACTWWVVEWAWRVLGLRTVQYTAPHEARCIRAFTLTRSPIHRLQSRHVIRRSRHASPP